MKKNLCLFFALATLAFTHLSLAQTTTGQQDKNASSGMQNTTMRVDPGVWPGYKNPIEIFKSNPTQLSNANPEKIANDYPFLVFAGDPTMSRVYKLKNGLTVFLAQNKIEPRVQTYIAVKAGSKNDPKETTGLAHYLEHMLFKGTSNIGTTNWAREKPMLDKIAQLYEAHRKETDPEKKKAIYAEIDKISHDAAAIAIPNEYDKLISALGAKGTNAYTSNERTVYVNDIPANELEKWMVLESERFHQLVLRLFHTELEAVYEEYNMSQDRDGSKIYKEMMKALFPTHPYGTQTTIGEGEHLKNPSMFNIIGFFSAYYVPNNMAICISGDINFDQTIMWVDKYFGHYLPKPVPPFKKIVETPLTTIKSIEVFGKEAESVTIGFRIPGSMNGKDATIAKMIDGILNNGKAGIIDIHLLQEQKVLNAYTYVNELTEYGVFGLVADPREGQTLEECEALLLNEMEKVRKGEYEDWMMKAVVNDLRLSKTKAYETNAGRAGAHVDAFIKGMDWETYAKELDRMEKITKADVTSFMNKYIQKNYVVVYKRQGEDKNVVKVEKPLITPIDINRENASGFLNDFQALRSNETLPDFINYNEKIAKGKLNSGVEVSYIKNEINQLFELYYILDMGSEHDKYLSLAVNYLPYLGTEKYSPEELKKEFFKYGLNFSVSSTGDRTYVSLNGLESNVEKGLELFEHILSSVIADQKVYDEMIDGILKERLDSKSDKNTILNGALFNYAKYGNISPYTDILTENELKKAKPEMLVEKIKSLNTFKHRIFYYGQNSQVEIENLLSVYHKSPSTFVNYPTQKDYPELETKANKVLFVNYNIVQAQVLFLSKDEIFNKDLLAEARAFNEYFGSGLSSIVFQEIRETKALAYSAYANFSTPSNLDEAHYVRAMVSTQADKMPLAVDAMLEIMQTMPRAEKQFNQSIESVLKQIQSERITKSTVYWSYENAKRKQMDYDIRRDIYAEMKTMSLDDLQVFFNQHISGNAYSILVIGDKTKLDMNYLKTLGDFKELTLEEIFGY